MNNFLNKFSESIFYILLIIFIIIISFIIFLSYKENQNLKKDIEGLQKDINISKLEINLQAKSFLIYDIKQNKTILAKNENLTLPLASLSKIIILTAYLDFKKENGEKISEQRKNELLEILIESNNQKIEGLNKEFMEKYKLSLIDIAEENLFKKLKIEDIKMQNVSGLDLDEKNPSNIGSSQSIAKIYSYAYSEYESFFQEAKFFKNQNFINTNPYANKTFGILSSKTGFTDLAGGNLAIISNPSPNNLYVIVVMGSTKNDRFSDIEKLNSTLPFISKIKQI